MANKKSGKSSAAMQSFHMKAIGFGIALGVISLVAFVLGLLTDSPERTLTDSGFGRTNRRIIVRGFDSYSEYRGYFSVLLIDRTDMILFGLLMLALGTCSCFRFLWAIYLGTSLFAILLITKIMVIMTAMIAEQYKPMIITMSVWLVFGAIVGFGYYVAINGQETIRIYKKSK